MMIRCPKCRREYSSERLKCPHCAEAQLNPAAADAPFLDYSLEDAALLNEERRSGSGSDFDGGGGDSGGGGASGDF